MLEHRRLPAALTFPAAVTRCPRPSPTTRWTRPRPRRPVDHAGRRRVRDDRRRPRRRGRRGLVPLHPRRPAPGQPRARAARRRRDRSGASSASTTKTRSTSATRSTRSATACWRRTRRTRPGGLAAARRVLGPGAYDVAVSGAGNRYFHPLLAGSGYAGSTGDYNLLVSAADAATSGRATAPPSSPPTRRRARSSTARRWRSGSTSAARSTPPRSPPARRCSSSPTRPGTFGDGNDQPRPPRLGQLQRRGERASTLPAAAPGAGLVPGVLAGDSVAGRPRAGLALGDPARGRRRVTPRGRTTSSRSGSTGIEGAPSAADTPATAHDLGDVTAAGLVQVAGAIGNDPFYDPTSPDPALNPGNDVEIYHFQVTGPAATPSSPRSSPAGSARRSTPASRSTGSTRRPGRSSSSPGNNNTGDAAPATDGSTPLCPTRPSSPA